MSLNSKEAIRNEASRKSIIFFSLIFLIQAIYFHWTLGTIVWIYLIEGIIIGILAIVFSLLKGDFKSLPNFLNFTIFLIFLGAGVLMLTFASDSAEYYINGRPVTAEEFTVFKNIDWFFVRWNSFIVLIGNAAFMMKSQNTKAFMHSVGKRILPMFIIIAIAHFIPFSAIVFIALMIFAEFSMILPSKSARGWYKSDL